MTLLGCLLVLMGAAFVVAEAHVPSGLFGAAGGIALIAGAVLLIAGLGGGAALMVPIGVGIGGAAAGWTVLAASKTQAARRLRVQSGTEALEGRVGVVRGWSAPTGQVFVDGALWRARCDWDQEQGGALGVGDPVVVERVSGLTLSVRRAEEWELLG